jgi:chromosome segregation ATPase
VPSRQSLLLRQLRAHQLGNRLLLSSLAFAISFGLGWVVNQALHPAILTGLMSLSASYVGAVVTDRRRDRQEKHLKESLQNQIAGLVEKVDSLELYESQLYELLANAATTKQELEDHIQRLQLEKNSLKTQLSQFYKQRQELMYTVFFIQQRQKIIEEKFPDLKTKFEKVKHKLKELDTILNSKVVLIKKINTKEKNSQAKIQELTQQIQEKIQQRDTLTQEIQALENGREQIALQIADLSSRKQEVDRQISIESLLKYRQHLEKSCDDLQARLEQLNAQQPTLDRAISERTQEIQPTDDGVNLLRDVHQYLQEQIIAIQNQLTVLREQGIGNGKQ